MQKQRFTVLIEKDEDGIFIASVPALPGCHTQADNLDDLEERIKEVIKLCLTGKNTDNFKPDTFVGVHQIEVAI
ncbi:MAG: type II toxin-antitoxin system HicB family antitoxin [Eubacteriales bacterium]|jgi:predicted RNase H-like HicB family nuclease